jgi:hypothetical protein
MSPAQRYENSQHILVPTFEQVWHRVPAVSSEELLHYHAFHIILYFPPLTCLLTVTFTFLSGVLRSRCRRAV